MIRIHLTRIRYWSYVGPPPSSPGIKGVETQAWSLVLECACGNVEEIVPIPPDGPVHIVCNRCGAQWSKTTDIDPDPEDH